MVNPGHMERVARNEAIMVFKEADFVYARQANLSMFSKLQKSNGIALDYVGKLSNINLLFHVDISALPEGASFVAIRKENFYLTARRQGRPWHHGVKQCRHFLNPLKLFFFLSHSSN